MYMYILDIIHLMKHQYDFMNVQNMLLKTLLFLLNFSQRFGKC